MDKTVFDIITKITEAAASGRSDPMAGMSDATKEMEEMLSQFIAANPEAAGQLAPLLEQAQALDALVERAAVAEAAGDTEAMLEISKGVPEIVDVPGFEPETDPDYNALSEALDEDDDAALAAVLDALGDLNRHLGRYDQTPLGMALAAPGRSAARVGLFLDRGARADFATPEGYTPLHYIGDYMWNGDTPDGPDALSAIVATLVAAGADIEARTDWGWTPLVRATVEGSTLEMRALLDAGADPNATVGDEGPSVTGGKSLLVLAAANPEKIALLLDHGADVAASGVVAHIAQELAGEDPDGYTPYWDGLRASQGVIAAARRQ